MWLQAELSLKTPSAHSCRSPHFQCRSKPSKTSSTRTHVMLYWSAAKFNVEAYTALCFRWFLHWRFASRTACPYHACCRVHVAAATECRQTMLQENSTFRSCLDVMQVSTTDHATSFWFEQHFNGDRSALGLARAAELPIPNVPFEATFPFFKPGSLSFYV